ncbi:hypothetical protein CD790_33160 [Streptomyces sp. SAJ15]|nr:hypothetical protein CD790_33160 [Streptomyces sp. SAJ15]
MISQLRQTWPSRAVIALLEKPSVDDYRSALTAGAQGVVGHDAQIEEIGEAVRCALRGNSRLPSEVAQALADRTAAAPSALVLSGPEMDLLHQLASGTSIADVARSAGYSERQMYRLVRNLYGRVGARNRSEAIAAAARWGLLAADQNPAGFSRSATSAASVD